MFCHKRKAFFAFVISVVLAAGLSGCGKSNEGGEASDSAENTAEATSESQATNTASGSESQSRSTSASTSTDDQAGANHSAAATLPEGGNAENGKTDASSADGKNTPEIDFETIKPYEAGQIMVIMYHGIVENPTDQWQRSREDFRGDLQRLYDNGFRLVSMKELAENRITTEAGFTPVVITFDDGLPSEFTLTEENGKLTHDPQSGYGIMWDFYQENPDFGFEVTFFVNGDNNPFGGAGTIAERFNYIVESGADIGNHTYSHVFLSDLNGGEIQEQLAKVDKMIKEAVPGYEPVGLAYPYGRHPKEEFKKYLSEGTFEGHSYKIDFALAVGQSGFPSVPNRNNFTAWDIPRVLGNELPNEPSDLGGQLRLYETNPEYRYISDGNPDRICVPKDYEVNVNLDSLNGKELFVY